MAGKGLRRAVDGGHAPARLLQARDVNPQEHQGAPRLLREVLGNRLPDKQEKFFRKLLGREDEVNYGARSTSLEEAHPGASEPMRSR